MTGKVANQIFYSKYFLWPFLVLSLSLLIFVVYLSGVEDEVIFPATGEYNIEGYTDQVDEGNSQILEETVSDSSFIFRFRLKDGFFSPYAGFAIKPGKGRYIDASDYNELRISLLSENANRLGVGIYTPASEGLKLQDDDEILHHSYFSVSPEKATYRIPFSQLKHPEWWEDLHQIGDSEKTRLNLNRILHININTAYSPDIDTIKTLEVYSITFCRNNTKVFIILGCFYLFILLLIYGFLYWRNYRNSGDEGVTVFYKAVEVSDHPPMKGEVCVDYINNHFQDSDLSLDLVARETGIPQRQIAQVINHDFNCNFKTYINRIRIMEAKRLLRETKLNIGEIAYKVGFNNQSHFNRVFKSDSQISPSEYRENQG